VTLAGAERFDHRGDILRRGNGAVPFRKRSSGPAAPFPRSHFDDLFRFVSNHTDRDRKAAGVNEADSSIGVRVQPRAPRRERSFLDGPLAPASHTRALGRRVRARVVLTIRIL
jgi:hypothetical protein